MMQLVAHRGASFEEPENTLSAFKRALEIGVDFIELDVHLSKDGVPVVIHDATLSRTTDANGDIYVRETSLKELKQFDAGAWFKGKKTEEKIPTLEEVFHLPLNDVGLMIELKDDVENDLSRAVMRLLKLYKPQKTYIASFSKETLSYFMQKMPEQPLIGLAESQEEINLLKELSLNHLAIDHSLFHDEAFQSESTPYQKLWSFTVNDKRTAIRLLVLGVEGIITNHPLALKPLHFS